MTLPHALSLFSLLASLSTPPAPLPFSDPPLTDEEVDALLAAEMGAGDLADLEGSDA